MKAKPMASRLTSFIAAPPMPRVRKPRSIVVDAGDDVALVLEML